MLSLRSGFIGRDGRMPGLSVRGTWRGLPQSEHARLTRHDFSGPHPAGLVGTHVHFLMGASLERIAWTVGYQDVIAIGRLVSRRCAVHGQSDIVSGALGQPATLDLEPSRRGFAGAGCG